MVVAPSGLFRISEAALHDIAARIKTADEWSLSEAYGQALEHALSLHDEQLSTLPSHRIEQAVEQLNIFLANDALSSIASDNDQDT